MGRLSNHLCCMLRTFEISLRPRFRSWAFLLLITLACLFLAIETLLVGIASSPATLRAPWFLALNSSNPALQFQLGELYKAKNPQRGIEHLRRATELSRYSRFYWSSLARACEAAGDTRCVDQARERLLELCPMVPLYHWYAAQRDLQAQQVDAAVVQIRRLLELDPSYASATWATLRTYQSPDAIFREMFGSHMDPKLALGYIVFLNGQGQNEAAYSMWKQVVAAGGEFSFVSAQRYLERLIDQGRIEEAAGVWQDLGTRRLLGKPGSDETGNLVFNGGFERIPLNKGFDWRWREPLTYLAVDFAAPGAYRGARCLRIDFSVSRNQAYEPVYQIVPVLPTHTYHLEAYVRSEEITSDTGPVLRVRDAQQPGFPDAVSETTVGTTPWHRLALYFTTGPQTRAIQLSVWRPLGRVFPTEISGSFWLDAVSLKCVDCDPVGVRQRLVVRTLILGSGRPTDSSDQSAQISSAQTQK